MAINISLLGLDIKLKGFAQSLFLYDNRWNISDELNDHVCYSILDYQRYKDHSASFHYVLDFQDGYPTYAPGHDFFLRDFVPNTKSDKTYFVFKLQFYNIHEHRSIKNQNIQILSCPLLLGGSDKWIHDKDMNEDGSLLFQNNLIPNIKKYKYDYCYINNPNPHRYEIQSKLNKHLNGFMKITSAENRIPYLESIDIHRTAKVNISLNGHGYWCLKDAEMFSRNCFILRQNHPNINLNPLTPKDRKHWIVFNNEEFDEKLQYYIANDKEREEINDAGFKYFSESITGSWAKVYTDALLAYFKYEARSCFEGLIVNG